jgi:Mlc titration factor MtfA (ptsG expression regulator)
VKVRPEADRWFAPVAGAVLLVAGTGVGALVGGPMGAIVGGLAGGAGAGALWTRMGGRAARRQATLASPFPPRWRDFLLDNYDHYDRLPPDLRRRFEDDVRIFMSETRITGIEAAVTDELRLLVAASAVTLSVAWPDYEWDQLTEVLLYPHDFDRDYSFETPELAGQAHPWGTVILSIPALRESFADPDDGYHVGIHEFAHLLGWDKSQFSGIPPGLAEGRSREWVELAEREMDRLRRGKSVIDDYGASDPIEFLAVSVEAFFECALALRQRHREVYAVLAEYFRQDPAGWDDARGLKL